VLFSRRARDLYKRGPLASVQILLAADNFSDLINRYHYLYLVALQDRLIVRQIEDLETELERHRQELQREVSSLRDLRTDKVSELQDLYRLEQERARRLSAYRGQQSRAQQRLQQLARDEKELNGLIGQLEREREAAEAYAASPTRGTLTPGDAGKLDWPVEGRILYGFGQQRNSDGTVILRHGIGIAAKVGTPVRAVQAGTVVFAEPYLGFGPSVIISHGGGYYSLYLHLSDVIVATGTSVTRGQLIGKVGGAGTHEGPHLEFQVWQNRKAVDPLDWLRKRR
jgi:septal ring factor EnvC (AmiA/AmiB activator)